MNLLLATIIAFFVCAPGFAAQKKYKQSDYQIPGLAEEGIGNPEINIERAAQYIQTTTAVAISPLLVVGGKGFMKWYRASTESRSSLPLLSHPYVWGLFLGIGFFFIINSFIGTFIPILKKPMDFIEPFEHAVSGLLIGLPFILSMVVPAITSTSQLFEVPTASIAGIVFPLFGAATWASATVTTIVWTIAVIVCFLSVWAFSQFMNLLIVLSPWGGIDLGLRLCKGVVLATIFLAGFISPWLSILICLLIITFSLFTIRFTLRACRYISYLATDFMMGHFYPYQGDSGRIKACAISRIGTIKKRSVGWIDMYEDRVARFQQGRDQYFDLPSGLELRDGFLGAIIFDPSKETEGDLFRVSKRYRLKYVELSQRLQLAYSPPVTPLEPITTISYPNDPSGTDHVVVRDEPKHVRITPSAIWGYIKYGFASYMLFSNKNAPVGRLPVERKSSSSDGVILSAASFINKISGPKTFFFRTDEEKKSSLDYWAEVAKSGARAFRG